MPSACAACGTVSRRLDDDSSAVKRPSPTQGILDHQDRRRKPLEANLAPLKTNTRAGVMPRNPARKSCRAVRIEKITALTKLRHSSTGELHMLHISGHFSELEESKVPAGEAATQWW
jgi:hypothetical protein